MSQNDMILRALRRGRKITQLDALEEFGCFRLGARIQNLRDAGYKIKTIMVKSANGKRFAQYCMDRK